VDVGPGEVVVELPPPHPAQESNITSASASAQRLRCGADARNPKARAIMPASANHNHGPGPGVRRRFGGAAPLAVVATVAMAVAVFGAFRASVVGATVHEAAGAVVVQETVTDPLNPPVGAKLSA
jgi:hypothetical protein